MNPGQEERDSAASKGADTRSPWNQQHPCTVTHGPPGGAPRPECPLGTAAPSREPPPRAGLPHSGAHGGRSGCLGLARSLQVSGSVVRGRRLVAAQRGPKGEARVPVSKERAGRQWPVLSTSGDWGHVPGPRLKEAPWSPPQPLALRAQCGGQPGTWGGGQAASGARGALLGQGVLGKSGASLLR